MLKAAVDDPTRRPPRLNHLSRYCCQTRYMVQSARWAGFFNQGLQLHLVRVDFAEKSARSISEHILSRGQKVYCTRNRATIPVARAWRWKSPNQGEQSDPFGRYLSTDTVCFARPHVDVTSNNMRNRGNSEVGGCGGGHSNSQRSHIRGFHPTQKHTSPRHQMRKVYLP